MLNIKVRAKNLLWWLQMVLAVFVPVLGYMGLTVQDLTSWTMLGRVVIQALGNPYVLGIVAVGVLNALTDPTTVGLGDSQQAMGYTAPKPKA